MRNMSFSLSALFVGAGFLAALTTEVTLSYIPVPENATRVEVRATNANGTLLAGNVQYESIEMGFQSKPAYWLKRGTDWEIKTPPQVSIEAGSSSISAIDTGFQEWLVGHAMNGTKVEGYAYNYASGQVVWGGALQLDLVSTIASRFTGLSSDGLLFCGMANRNDQEPAPIIFDRNSGSLEQVPVPEGFDGGWLHNIAGEADAASGVGVLYTTNDDTSQPSLRTPARWTRSEGLVPLPTLAEGKEGELTRISIDGATGFGKAVNADGVQMATIWHLDQGGQPEALPLPAGEAYLKGQATSIDPITGRIAGSVYYDLNPDDEVPGEWMSVFWDADRNPVLVAEFIGNSYGVDLNGQNLLSSSWSPYGGGIFGNYSDSTGAVNAYHLRFQFKAAGFEILEPLAGGQYYAEARGISNDGSRISGISSGYPASTIPATWAQGEGWSYLPAPENVTYTPYFLPASDITPDGQFIVGRSPSDKGTPVGFIWNNGQSNFYRLTDEEGTFSRLTGISFDGTVAVGQSAIPGDLSLHAMVVRDGVASSLSYPAEATESWAYDVSGDGKVAAGWATYPDFSSRPLLWDLTTGNHQILNVPEGTAAVDILAVSEDGSILAGAAYFFELGTFLPRPIYWDADRNPILIPSLGEFQYGAVWSLSADGTLLLGQMLNPEYTDSRGFIHQIGAGTRDLHTWYLEEHQIYLDEGYRPASMYISANGRWFCGTGPDPFVANSSATFRVKVPDKTAEDSFGSDSISYGDSGWVETWFGFIKDEQYPLVHHQQHGWLEMKGWGPDGGYFYDTVLGWMFAERGRYPIMQQMPTNMPSKWLYYELGSDNPRRFYDYSRGIWVTEEQLRPL